MTRIGVRELRQHASRYLDMVKGGAIVEVTERGELVALLVPPGQTKAARDRLLASGRLLAAKAPFAPPVRRVSRSEAPTASKVLADLRAERSG